MRFFLAFALMLFGAATLLPAQTFRASVLAGVNLSQIDGDSLNGFRKPGINVGLRVVALLGERWRIGPEILYAQQGARRNRGGINFSSYDRFHLNTVEVPLMVYYKDWKITAEAGASYQRVIDFEVDDVRQQDITETRPLAEQAVAVKFGATLYLTPSLGVNFRWSKQLTNISEFGGPRLLGRWLSLRAVWTIGGGEELPRLAEPVSLVRR